MLDAGLPGIDGLHGLPGKDAEDISPEHQDTGACFHCPQVSFLTSFKIEHLKILVYIYN
jgi:hypothetical protein